MRLWSLVKSFSVTQRNAAILGGRRCAGPVVRVRLLSCWEELIRTAATVARNFPVVQTLRTAGTQAMRKSPNFARIHCSADGHPTGGVKRVVSREAKGV